MKERFLSLCQKSGVKENYQRVTFGTFHGIFLRHFKTCLRFDRENIISEEQRYDMLREIIYKQRIEIEDEKEFFEGLVQEISQVKNNRIPLEHYYSKNCPDRNIPDNLLYLCQ